MAVNGENTATSGTSSTMSAGVIHPFRRRPAKTNTRMPSPIKRPWIKSESPLGRILQNTAWLLGGKGVGAILSLGYLAIVTRTLGPSGFGHFALILSTAQAISTIVSFESWQVIVKYGQEHLREGDGGKLGRLVGFCIAIDIAGALTGCAIAAAAALLLGPHFGWSSAMSMQAVAYCAVILLTIRSTPTGLLRLFDRFDAGALAETMIPIARMAGAVIAWLAAPGITAFLIAWAAAELVCAVTYWSLALKTAKDRLGHWSRASFLQARHENAGIMSFLTATNLSTTVSSLSKQLSVLLVGFFVGAAGAGLYRLAHQLSNSLTKISGLLSRAIFAELAKVHAGQNEKDVRKLFRRTNRLAIIAGAIIIMLILTLGKPLLLLMAGPAFGGAYPLLLLLGIAASIDLVGVSFEPLLMATGHPRSIVAIRLLNALFLLAALAVLLPRLGATGAATSNMIVAVTGFLMMGAAARHYSRKKRGAA